jgi:hypothetical protein
LAGFCGGTSEISWSITRGTVVVSAGGAEIKLLSLDRTLFDDMMIGRDGHDFEISKYVFFLLLFLRGLAGDHLRKGICKNSVSRN